MARTNVQDVCVIIPTNMDELSIQELIDNASAMVTKVLSEEDLSTYILTLIEKWLTAHFIAVIEQKNIASEKIDGAEKVYSSLGEGLKSTIYGQTVLDLDVTGGFSKMGKMKATFKAVTR